MDGSFDVQVDRGERCEYQTLLIGANIEHQLDGRGRGLVIYYLDGSASAGRRLSDWLAGEPIREFPGAGKVLGLTTEAGAHAPFSADLVDVRRRLVESVVPRKAPSTHLHVPPDACVEQAIVELECSLDRPPTALELARRVGLRQRELSDRFRKTTGLTIRRYVLWLRIKVAVLAIGEGRRLTEAALAAGFADSAHLSRTFSQMFGVTPSESVATSEIRLLDE